MHFSNFQKCADEFGIKIVSSRLYLCIENISFSAVSPSSRTALGQPKDTMVGGSEQCEGS